MKKRVSIVTLLIIVMIIMVGCGSKNDSQPSTVVEEEKEKSEEVAEEAAEEATEESKEEKTEETAATEATEESSADSQIASKDEKVEAEDVVEDWMKPILVSELNPGTYPIQVSSSSSMFTIESAELNVTDNDMTVSMTMGGKGYRYLYMGTPEEAVEAEESEYIPYEENTDGAHVYTVPVEALDQGSPCAAFSNKKEKWYDRVLVFRSDSLPLEAFKEEALTTPEKLALEEGEYSVDAMLYGGTGRATIESPTKLTVSADGCNATITWSSPNYDYMIVDGEKYLPINEEGNSVYEIPVKVFDRPYGVIADTVAMSEPHEISYALYFDSASIK